MKKYRYLVDLLYCIVLVMAIGIVYLIRGICFVLDVVCSVIWAVLANAVNIYVLFSYRAYAYMLVIPYAYLMKISGASREQVQKIFMSACWYESDREELRKMYRQDLMEEQGIIEKEEPVRHE